MKFIFAPIAPISSQNGSALLEALIAILLFSIGILGVIAMQATGTKVVADARYRVEAGLIADDLMGRIWSDVSNAALYDGFDTNALSVTPISGQSLTPASLPNFYEARCLGSEATANALCRWGYKALATLPRGRATINSDDAGIGGSSARTVTILLTWTPPGEADQRRHELVATIVDR